MCQAVLRPQDTESWYRPILAGCAVAVWVAVASAETQASASESPVARTQANRMVEIVFTATQDYRDAFHEVTLDALFETPQGRTLKSPCLLGRRSNVEGPLRVARWSARIAGEACAP